MEQIVHAEGAKAEKASSWKQFGAFFRHAHLSWGWIALSMLVNILYYAFVTRLPGSTAALFAGKFTTKAIMGVVINYSSTLGLLVLVSGASLIAESKSVRSVRKAVWTQMMGIQTSYYDQHNANQLLSTITSDTAATAFDMIFLFNPANNPNAEAMLASIIENQALVVDGDVENGIAIDAVLGNFCFAYLTGVDDAHINSMIQAIRDLGEHFAVEAAYINE